MSSHALSGGAPPTGTLVRLFCLPYAVGSATAYRRWRTASPPGMHVTAVDYPGHGRRQPEQPLRDIPAIARDVAAHIAEATSGPYALFGHSMGGLVAYETVHELRRLGCPPPEHLFVSAVGAPAAAGGGRSLDHLNKDELVAELRALGATPPELLAEPELVAQATVLLRADSAALASYRHRHTAPLEVPLTLFCGSRDPLVSAADMTAWAEVASTPPRMVIPDGDHFSVIAEAKRLVEAVADTLAIRRAPGAVPPMTDRRSPVGI